MRKMNKKGFSLVELLATIAIIGILSVLAIAGVSRYVNGAHEEQNEQNRKTVMMAAELYFQANQDMLPKRIGEKKDIPFQQLRDSNFLKSDIKDDKGVSCMDYSFVRAYKLDKKEYSYTTFLYCGEEPTGPSDPPAMNITFNFVDAAGHQSSELDLSGGSAFDSNKVKDAYFKFEIYGGKTDDKQGGDPVGVYSYEYSILVADDSLEYQEVYSSGTIKAGRENTVTVKSDKLSKYIDVSGFTRVKVVIDAVNEQGGTYHFDTENYEAEFQDKNAPNCTTKEMAANDEDWINKQSREKFRRVTVGCQDNPNESGCKRKQFTQTWPYDYVTDSGINYKYGARWSYITIEDNAKNANTRTCYVRTNVDLQAPEVTVKIYKATVAGTRGSNILNLAGGSFTVKDSDTINDEMPSGIIQADQYNDLFGTGSEKWMNLQNYPNGILIDVELKDNLYLYSYDWEVNSPGLKSGTDSETIHTLVDGSEKRSGILTSSLLDEVNNDNDLSRAEHGTQSVKISSLPLSEEGKRYGRLTICDKAHNCTTIHIYADIDRTPPAIPTVYYKKSISDQDYTAANSSDYRNTTKWSNEHIKAFITDTTKEDNVSGWDHFNYYYRRQTGKSGSTYTWSSTAGEGSSNNYFEIIHEGIHRIHFVNCDKAGNCSNSNNDDYIKVDTIKPTCTLVKKYESQTKGTWRDVSDNLSLQRTNSTNGSGWLHKNQRVTLSHSCTDSNAPFESGCDRDNVYNKQSSLFDKDINTATAGANGFGENAGGNVVDYAGNMSEECPTMQLKIDTISPTCETTISWPKGMPLNEEDPSRPETGWLGNVSGTKRTARVGLKCSDEKSTATAFMADVSSGCDDDGSYDSGAHNQMFMIYDNEIITTTAGAEGDGEGGKVYDIAGNSTNCPADRTVKIDYTRPKCTTEIEYGSGTSASDFSPSSSIETEDGWLGFVSNNNNTDKKMARVKQVCTDQGTIKSNCESSGLLSFVYDEEINTDEAGAVGDGDSGSIIDRAGNVASCPANQIVKIDYTRPVCSVSVKSAGTGNGRSWVYEPYEGTWLGPGATVTIVSTCTSAESGTRNSSGCDTNRSAVYNQEISTTEATSYGNNNNGVGKTVYVYDKAGNRSSAACEKKTVRIDTTSPSIICNVVGSYEGDSVTTNYTEVNITKNEDTKSGVVSTTYSHRGSSNKRVNNGMTCGTAYSASVTSTDLVGNSRTQACTSYQSDGCCNKVTGWTNTSECNAACDGGTYKQRKYSIYNGQVCDSRNYGTTSCNTFSCCESTKPIYGSCESVNDCGDGTRQVNYYSRYNNEWCFSDTEDCDTGESCAEEVGDNSNLCSMSLVGSEGDTAVFYNYSPCIIAYVETGGVLQDDGNTVRSSCSSSCLVEVKWSGGGKYVWHGEEYTYTSWRTYKCGSKHCTPCGGCDNCTPGVCV